MRLESRRVFREGYSSVRLRNRVGGRYLPGMAAIDLHVTDIKRLASMLMTEDASGAVVFEGVEATAFVEALNSGTASAAYLREADEVFARLYTPEPVNRLFR